MYLGLGSNVGNRAQHLAAAVTALQRLLDVDAVSDVYRSEPWGYPDQPDFWNIALRARTALPPSALLTAVKQLETELGRTPSFHMGPRAIDIDILLYGCDAIDTDTLVIPHADMMLRPFVLRPLLDLDPALRHPVTGVSIRDALDALDGTASPARIGSARDTLGVV